MTARAYDTENDVSASKPGAFSFTVPRSALAEALGRVRHAEGTGSSLPILQTTLVTASPEGVTFASTDLDQSIVSPLPGVSAAGRGSVAVPLRRLSDIVGGLAVGTTVTISVSGMKATIKAGRANFELVCLPHDEYPTPKQERATTTATIETPHLLSALQRVRGHVSTESSRPILSGVLLEGTDDGLFVTATDGHTLAQVRVAPVSPVRGAWILPPSAVGTMVKLFAGDPTIAVDVGGRQVQIAGSLATLSCRLIEGPYPDYRAIMEVRNPAFTVTVDRAQLVRSVRSVTAMATDKVRKIVCQFRADRIDLSVESADVGRASDGVDSSRKMIVPKGVEFTNYTAFKTENIVECLASFAGDDVAITYHGPERALVLRDAATSDTPTVALVMPLHLLDGAERLSEATERSEGNHA